MLFKHDNHRHKYKHTHVASASKGAAAAAHPDETTALEWHSLTIIEVFVAGAHCNMLVLYL
jgi:hypothetical protein